MFDPLGLVAGSGELPVILAREAVESGRTLIVVSVSRESDARLTQLADEFQRFSPGQLKRIVNFLQKANVKECAWAGKVEKRLILRPGGLDTVAIRILANLRGGGDQTILSSIAEFFQRNGINIIDQRKYLSKIIVCEGTLSGKPSERVMADARYGLRLARRIADEGIGQTVVVKNMIPLAVEAIEGTDAAIVRGAKYGGKGVVVAKAAAENHDFRFDVPTVGAATIELMGELKAAALALESGRCFLVNRDETLRLAEMSGIAIVSIPSNMTENEHEPNH